MIKRKWYKLSAKGKTLGRLATRASVILMGKDKVDYRAHEDKGDFFIVTDAAEVKVSGKKETAKKYFVPSIYPGNSRFVSYAKVKNDKPEFIIYHAVKGMLPKNKLGSRMLKRLKVYSGSEHPHAAQEPIDLENKK
ncbi:MAG: 50S ribosomal protein L13 [Elusimicrobia bacterium]|nr:50S ribosomal protein L13 [Elusimicrobiota bacterium]